MTIECRGKSRDRQHATCIHSYIHKVMITGNMDFLKIIRTIDMAINLGNI